MDRDLFDDEHELFRASVADWISAEVTPHYLDWERDGLAPRTLFSDAGSHGFVGMAVPEEYGGGGSEDFRFNVVLAEELAAAGIGGAGLTQQIGFRIDPGWGIWFGHLMFLAVLVVRPQGLFPKTRG